MHIFYYLLCLFIPMGLFANGVYVDYLLWSSHQTGLEFAVTGVADGPIFTLERGKVFEPKCQFDSGVRVGFVFPSDYCWNIDLRYTFYQSNESASLKNLNTLKPLWYSDKDNLSPDTAEGVWHFQANVADIVMSECYSLGDCFSVTPYYGIKAAWNVFRYDITYLTEIEADLTNKNKIHNLVEMAGAGPRIGFRADWRLSCQWSIVSELSASCIFSELWVKREDKVVPFNPLTDEIVAVSALKLDSTDVFGKQRHTSCSLTPVIELLLGVAYTNCLSSGRKMTFFIGWEEQVWLYTEQFIHIKQGMQGSHGSLSLHGLVVRGELQY